MGSSKGIQVFTAVLIVALSLCFSPGFAFYLGNLLRIFGKHQLYLKEAYIIEQMAQVDMVVFDKTGTITTIKKEISYEGVPLSRKSRQS